MQPKKNFTFGPSNTFYDTVLSRGSLFEPITAEADRSCIGIKVEAASRSATHSGEDSGVRLDISS